jgi:protein-S-isoprenylcysteine O-methyltransferase Ste14
VTGTVAHVPRVPPPAYALGAAVAQRLLVPRRLPPTTSRSAATAAVTLASIALAAAAGREFRRHGTTFEPFDPQQASTLVTTGSNALTRNPMYVGMAGLLVAHAVWRGSWAALAPIAAFVTVIDRLQITAEEAALTEKFGAPYDAYRAATPRWLGLRSLALRKP